MASSWLSFDTTFTLIARIMAEKDMLEEWVLGGGKLVGWPVHTDFLRPTVVVFPMEHDLAFPACPSPRRELSATRVCNGRVRMVPVDRESVLLPKRDPPKMPDFLVLKSFKNSRHSVNCVGTETQASHGIFPDQAGKSPKP